MTNCLDKTFENLFNYVKKNNYEGIDLFDGLNSRLFKNTIFYKNRYFRLALIQFCKLSPINLRKIFLVPNGFNPKAGALFLLGHLDMLKITDEDLHKTEAQELYKKLRDVLIERQRGIGWGYNFDWQARAFYVPVGTPNVVTSVYVGKALLEYYEVFNDIEAFNLAKQIAEFIIYEMVIFENEKDLCFRYIPTETAEVHNANLLAASFLSSIDKFTGLNEFREKIIKSVNFSLSDINEDGSWPYGTKPFHRWVDNFHTAFNIESLIVIRDNLDLQSLDSAIEKVVKYYLDNMFTDEGLPKYYNNKLYPTDIHVIAESLIVLNKIINSKISCDRVKLAYFQQQILNLAKSFQDKKGYFYFQKTKYFWNKTPYIRWGQAWMFFALSNFLQHVKSYSEVISGCFVKKC